MSMYSPVGTTEVIRTRRNSFNGLPVSVPDFMHRVTRNSHNGVVQEVANQLSQLGNIISTAGVVYDSIHVMDKAVVTHGTVYYLVHVASQAYPLESYTIRRRYNDFKSFHATLSRHMPPAPFSLFKGQPSPTQSIDEDNDQAFSLHQEEPTNDTDTTKYLPPMPHGGLLTIMTSKENLVRSRIAQFNRILQAALDHDSSEVADALRTFIKEAPGGPVGSSSRHGTFLEASSSSETKVATSSSQYVSLRDYVVPEMCMQTEREARRRTASFGRQKKNSDDIAVGSSFHSRDSTTSTSSACVA